MKNITIILLFLCAIVTSPAYAKKGFVTMTSPVYEVCSYLNDIELTEFYAAVRFDMLPKDDEEMQREYILICAATHDIRYYRFECLNHNDRYPAGSFVLHSTYKIADSYAIKTPQLYIGVLYRSIMDMVEIENDTVCPSTDVYGGIVISYGFSSGFVYGEKEADDRLKLYREVTNAMASKVSVEELNKIIKKYDYIKLDNRPRVKAIQ